MEVWNKGIPNTWFNPKGLEIGWNMRREELKNRIDKTCPNCSKEFRVKPSLNRIIYCSVSCAKTGKTSGMKGKKGLSGKNSPHWKGGVTSKDRLERIKFRNTIQKLVFQRDNYKCTKCSEGGNLQVDHIQPWAEYVEMRFDINNCRTLCASCHYEVTFGRPMSDKVKGWGHNLIERIGVAK